MSDDLIDRRTTAAADSARKNARAAAAGAVAAAVGQRRHRPSYTTRSSRATTKKQKEERGTQSSSSGAALNIFMLAGHARSSGPMNEDPSACGRVPPLMRLRRGWLDEWGARFLPPFLGVRLGCKIRKQAAAEAAVATQRKNVGRPSKQKWGGHLSEHQQQEGIMRDFNVTQCRISGWSFRLFAFLSAFIYGTHPHPHDPCLSITPSIETDTFQP